MPHAKLDDIRYMALKTRYWLV